MSYKSTFGRRYGKYKSGDPAGNECGWSRAAAEPGKVCKLWGRADWTDSCYQNRWTLSGAPESFNEDDLSRLERTKTQAAQYKMWLENAQIIFWNTKDSSRLQEIYERLHKENDRTKAVLAGFWMNCLVSLNKTEEALAFFDMYKKTEVHRDLEYCKKLIEKLNKQD